MSGKDAQDQFRLGFLAAVEDGERGVVGGLLVTNRFGRPLEFQCTTPVKPNRTQQILYGPTLRPYMLSEVIGRTLVDKVGVKPHLVLIETQELLDLRTQIDIPVGTFAAKPKADDEELLKLGMQWLLFHADHADDREIVQKRQSQVPDTADLKEPFERIREALSETLKTPTARSA
ncbi:MAG TPA: hypothetical protein VFG20_04115 [Planctomycetaceae bacterium]|nr:hypothetical protein [Planctomycetaceae bacterium]